MATEKRLIDANALNDILEEWEENAVFGTANDGADGTTKILHPVPTTTSEMQDLIAMQPTVDAVEVVHGQYMQKPHNEWWAPSYVCLECGTEMMVADGEGRNIKPNLCPNCGAKMDRGTV